MADKTIGSLPSVTTPTDETLIPVEQNSTAKKTTFGDLVDYIAENVQSSIDGLSIIEIEEGDTSVNTNAYQIIQNAKNGVITILIEAHDIDYSQTVAAGAYEWNRYVYILDHVRYCSPDVVARGRTVEAVFTSKDKGGVVYEYVIDASGNLTFSTFRSLSANNNSEVSSPYYLSVNSDPVNPNHVATKKYVDAVINDAEINAAVTSVNNMTGDVELDIPEISVEETINGLELTVETGDVSNTYEIPNVVKENYIDTVNPVRGSYYLGNATKDGKTVRLTYRDDDKNTYFYLALSKTLLGGQTYMLSFDCEGVEQTGILFQVSRTPSPISSEGYAMSQPFELSDGRVSVPFTLPSVVNNQPFALYREIRLDDANTSVDRPHNTNIILSNFQIETGNATPYHPSVQALQNEADRIESLTRTAKEREGWMFGLMDEDYVSASVILKSSLSASSDSTSGLYASPYVYYPLPFPMLSAPFSGISDKYGAYIGNRGGSSAVQGQDSSGTDISVSLGIYFRLFFPGNHPSTAENFYNSLTVGGRVATPPENTSIAYSSTIGPAIVNVAETYVTAVTSGRVFQYGRNFLNSESIQVVNDENGNAMMECDSFVGIVLRGVTYSNSPYSDTTASKTISYSTWMQGLSNTPPWAADLIDKITATNTAQHYFGHDFKTTAEYAWMFWKINNCLFTDPANAKPGDIAFFREPQTSNWFDGVTHCAIVGDNDNNGEMTIYEVSSYDGETGGRVLQHVSLRSHSSKPAYFARPYGWS